MLILYVGREEGSDRYLRPLGMGGRPGGLGRPELLRAGFGRAPKGGWGRGVRGPEGGDMYSGPEGGADFPADSPSLYGMDR